MNIRDLQKCYKQYVGLRVNARSEIMRKPRIGRNPINPNGNKIKIPKNMPKLEQQKTDTFQNKSITEE